MANHSATRPVWADDTDLYATELEHLDQKTVDSISATGGVYSVTEDMVIGGGVGDEWFFQLRVHCEETFYAEDGVNVSGSSTFHDEILFYGDNTAFGEWTFADLVTIDGDLQVNNPALFTEDVIIGLSASQSLAVIAAANFSSAVGFDEAVTFNDAVTFEGTLNANGNVFLGGTGTTTELAGTTELRGPISPQTGGFIEKRIYYVTDANTSSRGPRNTEEVILLGNILTANRTFTISDTDAEDGAAIDFYAFEQLSASIDFDLTVKKPDGSDLFVLSVDAGLLHYKTAKVRRVSGGWTVVYGLDA